MTNPQIDIKKSKDEVAKATTQKQTEKEKARLDKNNKEKAAKLQTEISVNNKGIKQLETIIKTTEAEKAPLDSTYYAAFRAAKLPGSPDGAEFSDAELANLNALLAPITPLDTKIANAKNNIKVLSSKNTQLEAQKRYLSGSPRLFLKASQNSGSGSGGAVSKPDGKEVKVKGPYKYNLPLIMPARFSNDSTSPQLSSLGDSSSLLSPPGGVDAPTYWSGTLFGDKPGRGVLRVNREWLKGILNSSEYKQGNLDTAEKLAGRSIGSRKKDRSLYGFRFLYNPEKIQMAYDINADLHPGIIQTGEDKFLPLTKSSSSVSVNIILNRMEDMKYRKDPRLAIQNQVYFTKGETTSLEDEIKELHEKGTMYDLEYLFKVLNSPHATFNSQLNGETADMGFIRPSILELHLGHRLRYPVRVVNLVIEHKIFDPRMVPIFSVVSITFGRFIEFETSDSAVAGGGTAGGAAGARRVL